MVNLYLTNVHFWPQVVITFPEPNEKSDRVTIRGAKRDVDQCYKHLAQLNKELLSNNYREEVPIFKQFHKYIIGKEGANIKKVSNCVSKQWVINAILNCFVCPMNAN